LYMQDGQNLFDAYGSFSGEWAVDKALNRLFTSDEHPMSSCIVIGIENGGINRTAEYSPWTHPEYGGGEGEKYVDFVCQTLKPYVDSVLRTLPERENTGIMGSSMGGLISLYAALTQPQIFGMAGVFSPSLWFSKEVFDLAKKSIPGSHPNILLMAGQRESETMVSDLLDLYEDLVNAGHPEEQLHYDLHSDGEHAEWFWAREFEHALLWLLGNDPHHDHRHTHNGGIHFEVEKDTKTLIITLKRPLEQPVIEIRDYCHGKQFVHSLSNSGPTLIPYHDWEDCIYSIRLKTAEDLLFSKRIHLSNS
jgi:predicted alpha/beta superfamily hydrolase